MRMTWIAHEHARRRPVTASKSRQWLCGAPYVTKRIRMITSVATLLHELQAKEAAKLAQQGIKHAPTIGAMYEGLTRDLLDRAIPPALDLRVVDGFIEDHEGNLSPQIDGMLVAGEGRAIPYTSSYVWPIQRVFAVLEVKKNLYGADLDDAFGKLRTVNDMHGRHRQANRDGSLSLAPAFQAFAKLTGRYPRSYGDARALPDELSFIFHTLVGEQLAPVRIVFGYEGYSDEFGLRDGFAKLIQDNLATPRGFGIGSFPNLIVCRRNSLIKLNGQPYVSPMVDGWWPAIASNSENPIRLLIELIWARLANEFGVSFPVDDRLEMERFAAFLYAQLARSGDLIGWKYHEVPLTRAQLDSIEPASWEPQQVDENEWVELMVIAKNGEIDVRDKEFRDFAERKGFDPDKLIDKLVAERTLAWCDDHCVRLTSTKDLLTVFMPDGKVVTSNEPDLLNLWVMQELEKRGTRNGDADRRTDQNGGDPVVIGRPDQT